MRRPDGQTPKVLLRSGHAMGAGLARMLRGGGWEVVSERTERATMERLRLGVVDAAILPVRGSGRRVLAMLEALRRRHSAIAIILVGPDLGAEQVSGLLRAGALDYLTPPVRPERLRQSLQQGLAMRRASVQVQALSRELRTVNRELSRERDSLQRWNRNLVLLNRLTQAIAGTLDADEIVRLVGARLGDIVPFSRLGVMWTEPHRVWVHVPSSPGGDAGAPQAGAGEQSGQAPQHDGGAPDHRPSCRRFEEPSASPSRRVPRVPSNGRADALEVPLVAAGQTVGLARLESPSGRSFGPADIEVFKSLATSLALALRNAEVHHHLQNLAMTDGLTGLLNRRAFANVIVREFREADRYRSPLCLILVDLDHFKRVNDRFGHVVGDHLLREVAALIAQSIRSVDVVTRYGGEEFAVILPRTDLPQAAVLANRIRERIERRIFKMNGAMVRLTVSMGIAQVPASGVSSVEDFIAAADAALYLAKTRGRNRIEPEREGRAVMASPRPLAAARASAP